LANTAINSNGTWRKLNALRASNASAATNSGGACSASATMRSAIETPSS